MKKFALFIALLGLVSSFVSEEKRPIPPSPFVAKDYSYLYGMPGFTDKALSMHFKLYEGYVNTTNAFLAKLKDLRNNNQENSLEFAEFKRRLMWDFDGMRLHEDYFSNMGGHGTSINKNGALYQQIVADFGSYEAWERDFKATGAMRGIGWAVLCRDPVSGRLLNLWINEHDRGHLAGGNPLLIMDVFEHAYLLDYGLDRKKYINAFFNNINWPIVESRFSGSSS